MAKESGYHFFSYHFRFFSDCQACVTCVLRKLCSQDITRDDAMEMINKLYNMWPKRLQRGTDADATELLSFIIEAFKAEDLVQLISSKKISCNMCKTETVAFEESRCLGFYIHSKEYGSLSRHIMKNFEANEGVCSKCSAEATEKLDLEVAMKFFIVQVHRYVEAFNSI